MNATCHFCYADIEDSRSYQDDWKFCYNHRATTICHHNQYIHFYIKQADDTEYLFIFNIEEDYLNISTTQTEIVKLRPIPKHLTPENAGEKLSTILTFL